MRQRHARQATGHQPNFRATESKRPQIDMPWCQAVVDEGRTGRQRQRVLRNVVVWLGQQQGAEVGDFVFGRRRADQHAVTTGTVDLFHHHLFQIRQHVRQLIFVTALPGRHVIEDRLFLQIETHHVRHVRIDRLVVGHAGAYGIGQHHVAGAVYRQQPRYAEHRVRAERQRIEEGVIDPTVDHVHLAGPGGGAHKDRAVLDEQIGAFHQFNPHLLRQEAVFEIGAVKAARRQHHHGGIVNRRAFTQGLQQVRRVAFYRCDTLLGK